jgi:hypothetical protein
MIEIRAARWAATAITILSVLCLCASSSEAASSWRSIERTLQPAFDPTSPNPCNNGSLACPTAAVAEMQRRFDPLASSCSHEAVFSLAYLRVTQAYRDAVRADPHFFFDNAFVNHEDGLFADYYFRAYNAWYGGHPNAAPPAWRIAFRSADQRAVNGMGDLLLQANAHVNRDLAFVIDAVGLSEPDGSSLYHDHERVNDILSTVVEPIISEEARRFDPTIGTTEFQGTTLDDQAFFRVLVNWREEAWVNAGRLAAASSPQQWRAVAKSIDDAADDEAQMIIAASAYTPPLTSTASRDAYCAAHWNS